MNHLKAALLMIAFLVIAATILYWYQMLVVDDTQLDSYRVNIRSEYQVTPVMVAR